MNPDAEESGQLVLDVEPEQISFCTRSVDCKADVHQHEQDCPVEAELKAEFGF